MLTTRCRLFFFSSRRRHTRFSRDWSSDVCSSDLTMAVKSIQLGQVWRKDEGGQDYLVTKLYNEVFTQYAVLRQIGRASCRERCRSRWMLYHQKKNKTSKPPDCTRRCVLRRYPNEY